MYIKIQLYNFYHWETNLHFVGKCKTCTIFKIIIFIIDGIRKDSLLDQTSLQLTIYQRKYYKKIKIK